MREVGPDTLLRWSLYRPALSSFFPKIIGFDRGKVDLGSEALCCISYCTFITPKFAPSSTKHASVWSFELGMGWTMLDTRFFNGICYDVCAARIVKGEREVGELGAKSSAWMLWVHSWESCVRCDDARQGRAMGTWGRGIRSKSGGETRSVCRGMR